MNTRTQRKLAAKILKCGEKKIWVNPAMLKEVSEAITRQDIRRLVNSGVIRKFRKKGVSRFRAKKTLKQKRKGRRKGSGSRKGGVAVRTKPKEKWMKTVRALRRMLSDLKKKNQIDSRTYRNLYLKISGGIFRSRKHMEFYLKEHDLLKKEAKNE